jgi:enamine deaminase RidA (YjgF/YER057c/UK114 family)
MPMSPFKSVLSAGILIMNAFISAPATAQPSSVKLTIVNPGNLYDPAPNGYSHAVVAAGGRRIVMIAGQGGEDASGKLSPRFADQVKQAYANLRSVLDAVGAKPAQVAKLTTYVAGYDQSLLPVMTQHVKTMFGAALPAQTLVPVPRLALDGMLFEVDAVVILD